MTQQSTPPDPSERMSTYDLPNGKTLHRFVVSADGREWACMAYDHGPLCRLCQPVDGVLAAYLDLVVDGSMEARQDGSGTFSFHVTDAGMDQARHLIRGNS